MVPAVLTESKKPARQYRVPARIVSVGIAGAAYTQAVCATTMPFSVR